MAVTARQTIIMGIFKKNQKLYIKSIQGIFSLHSSFTPLIFNQRQQVDATSYSRVLGAFCNCYMDKLFLNRLNSQQGNV